MKSNKTFLFLLSSLIGLITVNANAQSSYICAYTNEEKYRIEEAIKAGKEDAFITWCCEELGQCHPGYSVREDGYVYRLTHIAAKYNRPRLVEYFSKQRTNKDGKTSAPISVDSFLLTPSLSPDPSTYTQLMLSAQNGAKGYETSKVLLALGAKASRKNTKDESALTLAQKTKDAKLISLIKTAWDKEMGYSQMLIEKEKAKLRNLLKPEAIQKHFAQNSVVQTTKPFIDSAAQAQELKQI